MIRLLFLCALSIGVSVFFQYAYDTGHILKGPRPEGPMEYGWVDDVLDLNYLKQTVLPAYRYITLRTDLCGNPGTAGFYHHLLAQAAVALMVANAARGAGLVESLPIAVAVSAVACLVLAILGKLIYRPLRIKPFARKSEKGLISEIKSHLEYLLSVEETVRTRIACRKIGGAVCGVLYLALFASFNP